MSALWAPLMDRSDNGGRPQTKARLLPVPEPVRRISRIPFLMVLAGMLGLGMVGLLFLNTSLQNRAFQARALNQQATELSYHQADLERQVDEARAPQELAGRASSLGMRPNTYPVYLVLPEGKVIGKPTPVKGDELPESVLKPPEQFAAEQAVKQRAADEKAAKEKAMKERAAAKKAEEQAAKEKVAKEKAAAGTKDVKEKAAGKTETSKHGTLTSQAKKKPGNR